MKNVFVLLLSGVLLSCSHAIILFGQAIASPVVSRGTTLTMQPSRMVPDPEWDEHKKATILKKPPY